jgi:hypothetical protein
LVAEGHIEIIRFIFLLKNYTTLSKIVTDAQKKYHAMFSEKLFLEQLDYMDDITDLAI